MLIIMILVGYDFGWGELWLLGVAASAVTYQQGYRIGFKNIEFLLRYFLLKEELNFAI